jgi:hypothetical protein
MSAYRRLLGRMAPIVTDRTQAEARRQLTAAKSEVVKLRKHCAELWSVYVCAS